MEITAMFDFPGGQAAAFFFTFAVGAAGFFLCKFLRVPNPALLGSMVATGALSAAGLYPSFNTRLVSLTANVIIGITLGRQINRTVIKRMGRMIRPVLIQTAGMIVLSLICGLSMRLISGADLATSLVSGTAGGITEMIVFGMSIDADVTVIAFVQLFRIVLFLALIPYLAVIAEKITGVPRTSRGSHGPEQHAKNARLEFFGRRDYLVMIILAFAGGSIASRLKIPTGAMLGAMFAGGGMALFLGKHYKFDDRLRFVAQIGLGLVTGERVTPQIVELLGTLLVPTIFVTLIMLTGCTLLAVLLYKTSEWSLITCLLCASPAGLGQIVSLAEDVGADPLTASVFHTARIVGIVTFYPWIVLPLIS